MRGISEAIKSSPLRSTNARCCEIAAEEAATRSRSFDVTLLIEALLASFARTPNAKQVDALPLDGDKRRAA